jgi:hypothetical protein
VKHRKRHIAHVALIALHHFHVDAKRVGKRSGQQGVILLKAVDEYLKCRDYTAVRIAAVCAAGVIASGRTECSDDGSQTIPAQNKLAKAEPADPTLVMSVTIEETSPTLCPRFEKTPFKIVANEPPPFA